MNFSSRCQSLHRICSQHLHTTSITGPRLGVLGVKLSKGQSKSGVDNGPEVIRSTNFIKTLEKDIGNVKRYTVTDYGNIQAHYPEKDLIVKKIRNPHAIGDTCKQVSLKVQDILQNGDPVFTLGGDHSVAIGTIHGHAQVQPDMCLIWVDAHADINTATTTNSGSMHGMVNSFHLHELEPFKVDLPGFDWIKPSLRAKDIVYIGLRDVEPLERLILEKYGIRVFAMHDVDRLGILEVTKRALDVVNPRLARPIHVSFDIDAYDSTVAPSTGTSGLLTGLDLVEVNTAIGSPLDQQKTLFAANQTLLAFCGNNRAGNLPLDIKQELNNRLPPCVGN
uniref:Arginase n=1 Tax=Strigamia maritima TaxID=126957 RepID=T1IIL6_STRMM